MERQFFSGNTIEQAVMAAARHYGLDPDRVAYSLRDKKHGFLNIRRRVVIEVDPSAPEKPEARPEEAAAAGAQDAVIPGRQSAAATDRGRPAERPVPDRGPRRGPRDRGRRESGPRGRHQRRDAPRSSVWEHRETVLEDFSARTYDLRTNPERAEESDVELEIAAFEMAVDEVIELMDLDVEGTVRKGEDGFEVELSGDDGDIVVEDEGQVLRSIEHLLPRLVRGLVGHGLPCRVDCDGFQAERDQELRDLAGGMAEAARRQGKAQLLEPMNPMDRRVVHLELADDPTVQTESEGEGYMKRVKIQPRDVSRET